MSNKKMKAVGVVRYGGPDVLQQVELPTPVAGPGEVRVQVSAAAVNPVDVMLREGLLADMYADEQPPFIPGMDVAGTIDQIGSDVDPALGHHLGKRVTGVVDNHGHVGGYSQYVVLPATSVTAAPAGHSIEQAAAFLMPALTARAALDALDLAPGQTLLVTGAAGGVGRYAVALANQHGLRVVALARTTDTTSLKALGAETVIPRDNEAASAVAALFPTGVDAVIDTTTSPERFLPTVRDGGKYLSPRGLHQPPGRGITVESVNVRERVKDIDAITHLRELVEDGILPADVQCTYPAHEAPEAHRRFEQGHVRGRIILLFGADAK